VIFVLTIEKQILVVNTIVDSLEELNKILRMNTKISEQIHSTIGEILKFMGKVLKNFPEMLISKKKIMYNKQDIIYFYDEMMKAWQVFFENPDNFFNSYETFSLIWKDYQKLLNKLENNATTIYISLN